MASVIMRVGGGFSSWYAAAAEVVKEFADRSQEGLLTVVVSAIAYLWVYNYPATAEFLSDKERSFITWRLKNDNDATREEKFSWSSVMEAVKDPKVYLIALCGFCLGLLNGAISNFLTTLLQSFGFNQLKSVLYQMPGGMSSETAVLKRGCGVRIQLKFAL